MPDGERVTTGSEPRRTWELEGYPPYDGFFHRVAGPTLGASERVKVVEVVEPGHDEQTEGLLAVANQAGVSIHNADGPVLRLTLDEAVKLRDDFERALAVHGLGTIAAVVGALQEAINACINRGEFDRADGLRRGLNLIEERFKPSAPGGEKGPVA